MSIENLTLKEIRELGAILNFGNQKVVNVDSASLHPWQIGKSYYIRTVTMYIVGKLEAVYETELVLSSASWVANSGRFHDALKGGVSKLDEVEPFPADQSVIVGRGALIDATIWAHDLPKIQK